MIYTHAEAAEWIDPKATELERVARRLRQGAISERLAAERLRRIADDLMEVPW